LQIHCTRPLNPPILGDFEDRNSPKLGGWGANAGMNGTSQTASKGIVVMAEKLQVFFQSLQERLLAELNASRNVMSHPGAKGDGTEASWLNIFQKHLPYRYQADDAFVIDHHGRMSDQIDIVIYDRQYTPILYNFTGQRTIPAESVYAVLEVKQSLNKEQVEYAGGKVASVRRLERTNAPIYHAGGIIHNPRNPPRILGGVLTTSSSGWNPVFGDPFKSAIASLKEDEMLDIGCVMDSGSFVVEYEQGIETKDSIVLNEEYQLAFFFFKLLESLQKMGTVPAIDYQCYTSALESKPLR
jgi:hypothetical protein